MVEYINNGWTKISSVKELKEYLNEVPDFFECTIEVGMSAVIDELDTEFKLQVIN